MTLHASKGLEFDVVFLPGWEEGIFPSQRTVDENGAAGLEEERRLAYVGMTRARRSLNISFAHSRKIHGQWQSSIPSRFINEMPKEHIVEDYENDGNLGSRFHTSEFDLVSWEARAGYGADGGAQQKKAAISRI